MEQKINITSYLIDVVKGVEKAFDECQTAVAQIKDSKSYGKAAAKWSVTKGIITGCYFVVNNMENCESNGVLQDMLDAWEEKLDTMYNVIEVMRPTYWSRNEEV